jgi:hypothetical protein
MKYFLLALFFCLSLSKSYCQFGDTINWRSDYRLKVSDFQGFPAANSESKAVSSCNIAYKIEFENSVMTVKINCYFKRRSSWIKDSIGLNLLNHEQGHFNIAELFARKFRQAIKLYRGKLTKEIVRELYQKYRAEMELFDQQYDAKTNFSQDYKMQRKWYALILLEVKKLSAFL